MEAGLLIGFHAVTGALPIDVASGICGTAARAIGPHLGVTKRARLNLERALPGLTSEERDRIIRQMWENLGRVAAEYAHLSRIKCFGPHSRVEMHGLEHLERLIADRKSLIFFGGHFSNWELSSVAAVQYGLNYAQVYRAANNPVVEAFMAALRRSLGLEPITKGAAGARRIIAAIRSGRALGMLVDQKMNDGIPVPFFGRDAMTAPAIAELALRYDCAMVPVRVDRIGGVHFRLICYPPMSVASGANRQEAIMATMTDINRLIEDWVREQPEQWFWLHRRWSD